MADTKVSALTAASTVAGADLTYVVQGGVSKQASLTTVWAGAGVVVAPAANGTDDGTVLNAFIAANRGKRIVFPSGSYKTSIPIVVPDRTILQGAGSSPVDSAYYGTEIQAIAGFTGIAVVVSSSWYLTAGDWWHWSSVRDFRIACKSIATHGIALYQMGETSSVRDCMVTNATASCIRLAGQHAPATIINCNTSGAATYGLELGAHPTLGGNSGAVRVFGLTGDANTLAHVRVSGPHSLSIVGLKSEAHPGVTILIDGANTGGAAPAISLVGGYDQNPTTPGVGCTDVIKITGTTTPSITLVGYEVTTGPINASCKLINDTVHTKTVPLKLGGVTDRISLLTFGTGGQSYLGDDPILGNGAKLIGTRVSTDVTHDLLKFSSDDIVHLRAGASAGVALEDSTPTAKLKINTTGVGMYGVTPVARAAAITTPNAQTASYVQADVTSLKTAIDAIRVALTNIGITS